MVSRCIRDLYPAAASGTGTLRGEVHVGQMRDEKYKSCRGSGNRNLRSEDVHFRKVFSKSKPHRWECVHGVISISDDSYAINALVLWINTIYRICEGDECIRLLM